MCLIAFAIGMHPDWPLVVLANRDEWLDRPSAAAHWWPDRPGCFGGRDLRANGSWILAHTAGRLAVITNDPRRARAGDQISRGELVSTLVADEAPLMEVGQRLFADGSRYAGFQLVGFDWRNQPLPESVWLQNIDGQAPYRLERGVHTLTNAPLNTRWRKAAHLGQALADGLSAPEQAQLEGWLAALTEVATPTPPADHADYPGPGKTPPLVPEPDGPLASPFVLPQDESGYGTRVSTVLRLDAAATLHVDEWHWTPAVNPPTWLRRRSTRFKSRLPLASAKLVAA